MKRFYLSGGNSELIITDQYEDGSWPSNWSDGAEAQVNEDPEQMVYQRVISTGQHLEWLSIAPKELHPPHETIIKAAQWVVENVRETLQDVIDSN